MAGGFPAPIHDPGTRRDHRPQPAPAAGTGKGKGPRRESPRPGAFRGAYSAGNVAR